MHNDLEAILLSEKQIQDRVEELGNEITKDYSGKDLVVICVLKGAVFFMTDLLKRIDLPLEIDFMVVSSYGGTNISTTGEVKIIKDLDQSVHGKDVLIVEDIIDTGITLYHLRENIERRGANSVKIVSLLNKEDRRKSDVNVDYCGFVIPDYFVVGYGLDFNEKYRNLPYVGYLKSEMYR